MDAEKTAILQLKVNEETRTGLIALAGGERRMGRYLDKIVAELIDVHGTFDEAKRHAMQLALADLVAKKDDGEVKAPRKRRSSRRKKAVATG